MVKGMKYILSLGVIALVAHAASAQMTMEAARLKAKDCAGMVTPEVMQTWTASDSQLAKYLAEPKMAMVAVLEAKERWHKRGNIPVLRQALRETSKRSDMIASSRYEAALLLAEMGERQTVVSTLREALSVPLTTRSTAGVQQAIRAAGYLSQFHDKASHKTIQALAKTIDSASRRFLCRPLARYGDADTLRQLLVGNYSGTQVHAAHALGILKDKHAVPELTELLHSRYHEVRYMAAWALAAIGDERALPALQRSAHEMPETGVVSSVYEKSTRVMVAEAARSLRSRPEGYRYSLDWHYPNWTTP